MPVWKFRTIEDMNRHKLAEEEARLGERIRFVLDFGAFCAPQHCPRGVHKFRNIEEANAFRQAWVNDQPGVGPL